LQQYTIAVIGEVIMDSHTVWRTADQLACRTVAVIKKMPGGITVVGLRQYIITDGVVRSI
jgi:hypothetical protein